jgi:hypothetical protein
MSLRAFRSASSIGRQPLGVSDISCGMLSIWHSTLLAMLLLIRPLDLCFAQNAAVCSSLPYNMRVSACWLKHFSDGMQQRPILIEYLDAAFGSAPASPYRIGIGQGNLCPKLVLYSMLLRTARGAGLRVNPLPQRAVSNCPSPTPEACCN